jgi:hypothetical protein
MARREVTGKKPGVTADLIDRDDGPPDPDDDEPIRPRGMLRRCRRYAAHRIRRSLTRGHRRFAWR